ncbi:isovaleryl-CoA dehydrogenase [Plastoroseomonas hellenica]|uniref:isovaleryl-CoA dehydrogenase n=1 Tax=Plastoroseomonas hellenica TaxID=2687306 RepID=UPI0020113E9E|nr:isovaleryl-CoA dehydrogenase [Plastoroseomonas hellenica]MBR0643886.1 isovaleryl-CoA dehydrogenase [Plastoroseomonas hellenica]
MDNPLPSRFATHAVGNQPSPFADLDLFTTDRALTEAVAREGAGWAQPELAEFGRRLGSAETLELGRLANAYPPVLRAFDRYGHRRDEVEFHPAWHAMMALFVGQGLHASPWSDPRPGAHVARAAGLLLACEAEAGAACPIVMTHGAIPVLRAADPALAAAWLPKLFSRAYDPGFRPVGGKAGALIGMGMTEKQGGSDVRANATRAEPAGEGAYRLVGHKWFLSAPMCDAFLVLAQAPGGLTCFFLPRWTPDGEPNALRLQRLKDKVGNRSNASSEVEFQDALAWPLGEEGRGVPTIIEMATHTRLDCALGTAGLMRRALAEAIHHAEHRSSFGRHLADHPLMRNVLADLALEYEAAVALAMRLARAFDAGEDPAEAAFRRVVTPAAKYWVCKRGPAFAAEAMEVLGGSGYVEEAPLGRLYREMPVNSIWEGSGNIMCLDVLRAIARAPAALEVVMTELRSAAGATPLFDACLRQLEARLAAGVTEEEARSVVQSLVQVLQASLLLRFAPAAVSDAFCASRLREGGTQGAFGTLPAGLATGEILARARPG